MYKKYFSLLLVALASATNKSDLLAHGSEYAAEHFGFFKNHTSAREAFAMVQPHYKNNGGKLEVEDKYFAQYAPLIAVVFAEALIEQKDKQWFVKTISDYLAGDILYRDEVFKKTIDKYVKYLCSTYWDTIQDANWTARRIGLTLLKEATAQSISIYNNAVIADAIKDNKYEVFQLQFEASDPQLKYWYQMYHTGINDPAWTSTSRLPQPNDAGFCSWSCFGGSDSSKDKSSTNKSSAAVTTSVVQSDDQEDDQEEPKTQSTLDVKRTTTEPTLDVKQEGNTTEPKSSDQSEEILQIRTKKTEAGCCGLFSSSETKETKKVSHKDGQNKRSSKK